MTEIDMPPGYGLSSSDEVDDDTPFKILNRDNLPISIVGEAILRPFGRDNQKQRPNGIVLPTRRIAASLETNKQKPFTKSSGHIGDAAGAAQLGRGPLSLSHGNLADAKAPKPAISGQVDARFTRALDAKLKRLQRRGAAEGGRKPFVTTVKKGQFLEPPPEIACLIGLKPEEGARDKRERPLYAYASKPRVLNRASPGRARAWAPEAAQGVSGKVVDATLPYANLMVDKRVCRGSNFASLLGHLGDGESAAARAAEARRRALARRKAHSQQTRAAALRVGSPPPVAGRKHEPVQTDQYLEEIFDHPPMRDICTQTDMFLERPISPYYVPQKAGEDVDTQIYPGDLFDFDMEVQPILEVLVAKTIEQALIEVLEEEELAALREQQRRFLEIRAAEISEAQRLEERERRLVDEKNRRLREFEEGARVQKQLEERIAASVLMQGYIADLLPNVLEGLEAEGVINDNIKQDIDDSFMPWLMKEVTHELQEMVSSSDILQDIVREILEGRAATYKELNKEAPAKEEGEEGAAAATDAVQDDQALQDHLRLQQDFAAAMTGLAEPLNAPTDQIH